jgi:hypothetical protein
MRYKDIVLKVMGKFPDKEWTCKEIAEEGRMLAGGVRSALLWLELRDGKIESKLEGSGIRSRKYWLKKGEGGE